MKISFLPSNDADRPPSKEEILQLSWQEFLSLFPTEKHCFHELCKKVVCGEQLQCKNCGSQDLKMELGDRFGKCRACGTTTWFMAGTFFEGIKRAIAWLGCIWLFEHGVEFNGADLARLAGVANSTGWEIHKKVTFVINSYMEKADLAMAVPSAHFMAAIWKRSLETPANEHPIAEQAEIEKRELTHSEADTSINSQTSHASATLTPIGSIGPSQLCGTAKDLYQFLSSEPVHFDTLCQQMQEQVQTVSSVLVMMQLDGLVEQRPGDLYVRSTPDSSASRALKLRRIQSLSGGDTTDGLTTSIASILAFVRNNFHGISRKYLQLYLGAYWCHVDRGRWSPGSLLRACGGFRAISYEEVRAFVSPLYVKVMPC